MSTDMTGVTICAPCDQGNLHPESHSADTVVLTETTARSNVPREQVVNAIVHTVRHRLGIEGPVTIHQEPDHGWSALDWTVTQP